jgi:Flp pilus assembly protein TadG
MHRQSGQAIVLIAIMLAVVVGMAALAIDGSRAYALRRDLQAAVDAAALAAGDNLQQTGSYASAEQAATTIFASNLRLYGSPACAPAYAAPGASPLTVTCSFGDGTTLTQVVSALGAQGSQFRFTATRSLQLQFAKILTNGASPTLNGSSSGGVNNLLYTPTVAAFDQAGCGGSGGTAISISGSGNLSVTGDVVSSGTITLSVAGLRVAGDIYARCQSSVSGSVTSACYPSGASAPCSYPDVAGATRSGYRFIDPGYPAPTVVGGAQGAPSATVVLLAGIYAAIPSFGGGRCWFLSGGVYDWQAGFSNSNDFVSNELKPPDEPTAADNSVRATHQFWDTNGVGCSGGVQLTITGGPRGIPVGWWSFVVTSTRSDTYAGRSYPRESAPSMCYQQHINNSGQNIQLTVSNVPGATSYNIYAAPPGNGCAGPFGLAEVLPVSVPVLNTNTNPCPAFNGNGCTLQHESVTLDAGDLGAPFAPNSLAAPGVVGAYPPNGETSPLLASLPNQNPARGPGASGDRANENNCETIGGAYATCPAAVTPGAVVFDMPTGACVNVTNGGDTFIFSGYQYDWLSVYGPGLGNPPANTCSSTFGAAGNSAYIGLIYMPAGTVTIPSAYTFEAGSGGLMADFLIFNGSMPTISMNLGFAPVPPAAKLTG